MTIREARDTVTVAVLTVLLWPFMSRGYMTDEEFGGRLRARVDYWVARDELANALWETWPIRQTERFVGWLDRRLKAREREREQRRDR